MGILALRNVTRCVKKGKESKKWRRERGQGARASAP